MHHGSPSVGTCAGCGRALCLACAIPVRGSLVGAECLGSFVEDAPVVDPGPVPPPRTGDATIAVGFALVLVASALPWARFNDPGIFGAWTPGWPALVPIAAIAGLLATLVWRGRPWHGTAPVFVLCVLALLVVVGALVYRFRPPLLDGSSLAPLLAVLGAVVVLFGVARKAVALWRIQ